MNKIAEPFKGTGYRLQYHNHSQEFRNFPQLNGKAGMAILIEETDPDIIMFELDTHWVAAAGGDPVQWINKVSGRIPIIHYKDYAFDWKAEDTGMGSVYKLYAEIGQGNLNWPAITEACKAAGVEWYIVEQDRTTRDEFESLKISIDYMRSIGIK
jgi:sugar phosphate isomerase/epimerase